MDTNRWRCWGYTDHQGTLISALMICVHVPSEECQLLALRSSRAVSVTACGERNVISCDWTQLI
ncbi:unnamed protein product, partial [Staurois parvus]